jgi:hypothetical protein
MVEARQRVFAFSQSLLADILSGFGVQLPKPLLT